jgi:5-methyltetrahydrofolate--homocysteine methyltransferase
VKDASRSVGVASALLARDSVILEELDAEYRQICDNYAVETLRATSLHDARANRLKIDWNAEPPVVPAKTGLYYRCEAPLDKIRKYINWNYFFNLWQLKGKFPQIFNHPEYGDEARKLFDDANQMLDEIIANKLITANGVFGIFPANSVGDDIEIYADEGRDVARSLSEVEMCPVSTFYNLRNQTDSNLCLSDFIAPRDSGIADWLCAFAVTAGIGVAELAAKYETAGDDYSAIMLKALADRLAEAFAEILHLEVRRKYWGLNQESGIRNQEFGIRVSHGFPACPDHSEKATLFDLLHARKLGMNLTETFAMTPAATVSGLIFAHPQSRYFSVGKISDEQAADYAARKRIDKTNRTGIF